MLSINFKNWIEKEIIKENATGTSCIAVFARPSLPMIQRKFPQMFNTDEDDFFKKKKKKKLTK
ncbi:MAG: hypothetical protein M0R80_02135 [Proteobacteria bacterium]|jgi:hypothetical protein|nr:hypothetical protein [Pseudomonadota bacterium]